MIVRRKTSFERGIKYFRKKCKDMSKLHKTIELLSVGKSLGKRKNNHKLTGKWKNHWECHIESDWLIIYRIEKDSIVLVKTGTHTNLF